MSVRNDTDASAAAAAAAAAAEAARRAEEARRAAEQAAAAARAAEAKKPITPATHKDGFTASTTTGKALADPAAGPVSDKLPKDPADLPKLFPELKGADKAKLEKVWKSLNDLATGDTSKKLGALATLAKEFPGTLGNVVEKLGLKDNVIAKIATSDKALKALSTLTSEKANAADKTAAALSLAQAVGGAVKPDELGAVLSTALKGLPAAEKLASAISAWSDPEKSGLDKAKATLDLAKAVKDTVGKLAPQLANDLRALDGPLKAAGAALTLLDPKASLADKTIAAAQIAAELPDLKKDLTAFKDLLTGAGVKDADKVAEGAVKAADVAVKGLDPKLASQLSEAEVKQLSEIAQKVGPDEFEKVLKGVTDKDALKALTSNLDKLDGAAGKRLLSTLGELEHGVLNKTLKDPQLTESLAKLATNLDDAGAKTIGKILKDFDGDALKAFTKLSDKMGPEALKDTLKLLAPIADKGGSKIAGEAIKVLDKALGKLGVKITGDVAAKALKNLVKVIPLAGAIPNGIDAVKYTQEAIELRGKNNDLGMFAANMAKLNVIDGVAGIAMDLTGVGIGVDIAVSVVLSAAELAGDIAFDAEKEKYLADPENYQAPDWMKAVNVGVAVATLPGGLAELAAYYGPEGAAQLVQWGVEKGAKGAIALAEAAGVTAAEAAGDQLKLTGKMLHALADVVRNPGKYGKAVAEAARDTFNKAIEAGGQLADEAKKIIGDVVDAAKKAGKQGLETLKWIAQNPGPAARIAVDAVKDLINSGIDLATDAGKALYKGAVETLQSLQQGWENLKGAAKEKAKELIDSAKAGLQSAVDKAVELGEKGIDLVVWAANNPGEVAALAKKALTDVLAKGGELAKKAWDGIRSLGEAGLDLAKSAIEGLKNAGAAAVDTLKYVVQNPGAAARQVRDWAGKALSDMARGVGDAAKSAAKAIGEFVDARAEWAVKFAKDLLKDGVASMKEVAKAWATNLTEGGKAVLDGLKDLGDAGIDALKDIAKFGGKVADYAVDKLASLAKAGVKAAKDAVVSLADAGVSAAKTAASAVKNATNGEFSVRGYKIDLNPFW